MRWKCWKVGLHVQHDILRSVAVKLCRNGWQLCQWWQIPWADNGIQDKTTSLTQSLSGWRDQLPVRHEVHISFGAIHTVQRQLVSPGVLREADCERYVASATAHQMQMAAEELCWDYQPARQADRLHVTAARNKEIILYRDCADALRLTLTAVTPDASALISFFAWLPASIQAILCYNETYWLWATRQQWGTAEGSNEADFYTLCQHLALQAEQLVLCGNLPDHLSADLNIFDPWQVITNPCQPYPPASSEFAVALGLAIGQYPQWKPW